MLRNCGGDLKRLCHWRIAISFVVFVVVVLINQSLTLEVGSLGSWSLGSWEFIDASPPADAVQARQHDIEENQIEMRRARHVERLAAVSDFIQHKAGEIEMRRRSSRIATSSSTSSARRRGACCGTRTLSLKGGMSSPRINREPGRCRAMSGIDTRRGRCLPRQYQMPRQISIEAATFA